jgi:hypothetical protein
MDPKIKQVGKEMGGVPPKREVVAQCQLICNASVVTNDIERLTRR